MVCLQCTKEFKNNVYFQRFCSPDCRNLYWKETNKAGRNYKVNLNNAKLAYKNSVSVEETLQYLTDKDKDYLAASLEFLMYLYPNKSLSDVFFLIKENIK